MVNDILRDFLQKFVTVYLDDVGVYIRTLKEYMDHLRLVFQRFKEEGLKLRLKKRFFGLQKMEFLGYTVSARKISVSTKKVEAVAEPTTLAKALDRLWWNRIRQDVKDFRERCVVCQRAKIQPHMAASRYYPLHVPPIPLHTLGLDYLTHLHVRKGFNNVVIVVVDHLTRMAHFLPCTYSVTPKENLFLQGVYRLHGLPRVLVCDPDPKLVGGL
jgi:hypothetical protein